MPKRALAETSQADVIRYQLLICGLSQRRAARILGIDDRTMRYYCSGDRAVPRYLGWAMRGLIAHKDEWKDK